MCRLVALTSLFVVLRLRSLVVEQAESIFLLVRSPIFVLGAGNLEKLFPATEILSLFGLRFLVCEVIFLEPMKFPN